MTTVAGITMKNDNIKKIFNQNKVVKSNYGNPFTWDTLGSAAINQVPVFGTCLFW